ncbi:RDD family protein [Dysgonomonas sp. ZJ279]|uniref:RDD family protein n=1 Tax=Dysgonomonas sp. ZJ279 TaxID=2709796 RepID=UPI0013EBC1FD|nr:RDD family protein [Dysgonomonas sp. ZJ279]
MAIEVQTTQNVTIDYEPAGIGYRLLAYMVDWLVIITWFGVWFGILYNIFDFNSGNLFGSELFWLFLSIIVIGPAFFYDLLFETMNNGQSLGKMLFKIRVVNIDGAPPSLGAYLIRWLFRPIDFSMTEGILGLIMIVATKRSQRLGDYLAGTTVIDLKVNSKNRELKISDLDFHEDYKVSYTNILDRLSDKDVQTIIAITEDDKMKDNDYFNKRLADRIKAITGYTYDGPDKVFLKKVVSDYNYLSLQ